MRRRRSKGTWLPILGKLTGIEGQENTISGVDGQVPVGSNGVLQTAIHVLTLDAPRETQNDDFTLADIIGSEYLLRRIVGKFHCLHFGSDESPIYGLATAGFFVARADSENSFYPIGADTNLITLQAANESYSPLEIQTQREPWIWRRTWLLSNSGVQRTYTYTGGPPADISSVPADFIPASTAGYGSVADGPHVDAKTLRRVGSDDRLYFAVSAVRWPISQTPDPQTENGNLVYHLDYRLFGSLRKAKQRGAF